MVAAAATCVAFLPYQTITQRATARVRGRHDGRKKNDSETEIRQISQIDMVHIDMLLRKM